MWKSMPQLADATVHDYVLMDLDITHRVILVSQAAFEVSFAAPEKRQLPETVSSKAKLPPKKIDPKENPVPDEIGIANGLFNLISQVRSQNLVSIQQQDPIVLERKRIERPLPLLRPATMVVKLHHFCTKSTGYFDGGIRALRIHDIDFGKASNRFQTMRKMSRLISCRNNDGDSNGIGVCAVRGCCPNVLHVLHVQSCSGTKTEAAKM